MGAVLGSMDVSHQGLFQLTLDFVSGGQEFRQPRSSFGLFGGGIGGGGGCRCGGGVDRGLSGTLVRERQDR